MRFASLLLLALWGCADKGATADDDDDGGGGWDLGDDTGSSGDGGSGDGGSGDGGSGDGGSGDGGSGDGGSGDGGSGDGGSGDGGSDGGSGDGGSGDGGSGDGGTPEACADTLVICDHGGCALDLDLPVNVVSGRATYDGGPIPDNGSSDFQVAFVETTSGLSTNTVFGGAGAYEMDVPDGVYDVYLLVYSDDAVDDERWLIEECVEVGD